MFHENIENPRTGHFRHTHQGIPFSPITMSSIEPAIYKLIELPTRFAANTPFVTLVWNTHYIFCMKFHRRKGFESRVSCQVSIWSGQVVMKIF